MKNVHQYAYSSNRRIATKDGQLQEDGTMHKILWNGSRYFTARENISENSVH